MDRPNSPVWLPFASGNSARIELSLYNPATERSRPIEAYMVSDLGSDLSRSASRAAETVYAIAHEAGCAPPPTVVGFDLQGLENGASIFGQSSGLALALALAGRLWPAPTPVSLAATGEISRSTDGGPLQKIDALEAKGWAALSRLPPGGYFLYPAENEPELSAELKQALAEKQIRSLPVHSVAEALAFIVPENAGLTGRRSETKAHRRPAAPNISRHYRTFLPLWLGIILIAFVIFKSFDFSQKSEAVKLAVRSTFSDAGQGSSSSPVFFKEDIKEPVVPASSRAAVSAVPEPPGQATEGSPRPVPENEENLDRQAVARRPTITLSGNSGLAERLAQWTKTRLQASVDADRDLSGKLLSLSGRVELIEIQESWDSEEDRLSSSITAGFNGEASLAGDRERRVIKLPPLTVSGGRPLRQQLPDIAALLVARIINNLSPRVAAVKTPKSPDRPRSTGGEQGFE
ncbi:MAG: hypothetical protein JXR89_04600 [Deltaproteobacteria bacterium]|nr:hypothetical protein [Deltaproteobacteria bacterium]